MLYTFSTGRDVDLSLFRILVEQAPDAIIFADPQGIVRVWNAKATEVFGHTANDALGNSIEMIIPHELRKQHWQGFHDALLNHRTKLGASALAARALRSDGERLYVELAFSIVLDELARVVGIMAIARDITQRYLAGKVALKTEVELHSNKFHPTD
jgi:PAS domain S-box-containing protein